MVTSGSLYHLSSSSPHLKPASRPKKKKTLASFVVWASLARPELTYSWVAYELFPQDGWQGTKRTHPPNSLSFGGMLLMASQLSCFFPPFFSIIILGNTTFTLPPILAQIRETRILALIL